MPGFIPGGAIATAAHAAHVGARRSAAPRRRRRAKNRTKTARRRGSARRGTRARGTRRPKPGTKAWMAYIRGMKGKKRRRA